MGAQRRRGSRLRAGDTSRAPEAHTELARIHAPGQMHGFAAPYPREGVHAGKREFKDLQITLFRFFSARDRSPIGGTGKERQERAGKCLPALLPAPAPPASRSPGSLQPPRAQPAWGSCWHSAGQRQQHQVGPSKGAAPTPDPGPGAAWRVLEGSLVQADEWGVASAGPQKACHVRSDSLGRLGREQGSNKGQGAARAPQLTAVPTEHPQAPTPLRGGSFQRTDFLLKLLLGAIVLTQGSHIYSLKQKNQCTPTALQKHVINHFRKHFPLKIS